MFFISPSIFPCAKQISSVIHEDCLDVCYEGFIFRLQLVASQEIEAIQLAAGESSFHEHLFLIAFHFIFIVQSLLCTQAMLKNVFRIGCAHIHVTLIFFLFYILLYSVFNIFNSSLYISFFFLP